MAHILKKILVVDDDSIIRQTLRVLLRDAGFEVVGEASDGVKAMEILQTQKAGIVLLDIDMPGSNGLDVLKEIHSAFPGIEVVMLSGNASVEDVKTAKERGAAGYIVKPFNVNSVIQNINHAIQHAVEKIKSEDQTNTAGEKS